MFRRIIRNSVHARSKFVTPHLFGGEGATLATRSLGRWIKHFSRRKAGLDLFMRPLLDSRKKYIALDPEQVFLLAIVGFQIIACATLWLVLLQGEHPKQAEQASYFVYFLALVPAVLVGWLAVSRFTTLRIEVGSVFLWGLAATGAMTVVLVAKFINVERVVYYWFDPVPVRPFPFSTLRVVLGAVLGSLLFAALLKLGPHVDQAPWVKRSRLNTAIWLVGIAALIAVFDPQLSLDTLAYSPYVAPAYAVVHGATPMMDAFSQYGLNYLIFVPGLAWHQSFYTASAIVSALGVIMGLAYVSIVSRLGINWLLVFVGGIFTVFAVQSSFFYNINYTPSVYAMRFLPSVLLVAALVRIPQDRAITLASGAALGLCALWSFESLVFSVLVYTVWLVIRAIAERRPVLEFLRIAVLVALLALLPHAVLTLAYLAVLGTPPRYDIYFELIFGNFEGAYWYLPVEEGVHAWVLFGLVYGSALAIAGYQALAGSKDGRWAAGLAALAALGVLQFYYYVGRSTTPVLVFLALPMMLLLLLACDWAVDAWRRRHEALPGLAWPTLGGALVLFAGMGAVIGDRLYDPIDQNSPNSMVFRICLPNRSSTPCSLRRMSMLIRRADVPAGEYPRNQSGGSGDALKESESQFKLVQRFAKEGERRMLLFGNDPVPVIFHSNDDVASRIVYPPHALGIVYPSVDGLSPTLRTRALAALDGLRAGDIAIRGKLPVYPLDKLALSLIEGRWTLCSKEKVETAEAFELVPKSALGCGVR